MIRNLSMEKIASFLVGNCKLILVLTFLITVVSIAMLSRVEFNADVTSFMLEGNERGEAFADLQEKYDSGDPITVLLEREGGWQDKAGLKALIDVRDRFSEIEEVASVGTLVPEIHPLTGTRISAPMIELMPPMLLKQITDGPAADLLLTGDGKSTMMAIHPSGDPIALARRVTKVEMPDGVEATFAGNPVVFASVIDMLGWFLLVIPPIVIALLLLVFTVNIGSFKLAVLSIVPAVLGSIWTFGLVFALGFQIDVVTIVVPIFVIVMGSADGLHFVTHLQARSKLTPDPIKRTAGALREVGVPMILTTISTAAGFLSLLVTDIGPIRHLGVCAAIGITFAGVVSFFSLPALLSMVKISQPSSRAIGGHITSSLKKATHKPVIAALVTFGLIVFAGLTLPGLAVNPDQLFFFKDDHQVRRSFQKMTDTFGGATPMFGEFAVDPEVPIEEQFAELRSVSDELASLDGVQRVFSVLDVIDQAPPVMHDRILSGEQSGPMGRMVSKDGLRFILFPDDFTTEQLQGWLAWADDNDRVRVLTGMPVLFDEMSRLVFAAQVKSLAAAMALLFLMLLVAYRRIGQTLVAMFPLALTCGVLLGFIAISGIQLYLLTAIITAIVIGVTIDYAIHLVAAIEHAREQGPGYVLRGIDHAGRPIVANALGIAVGMSALFFSPFKPHNHIAAIMWVSMIVGAITALLIIPAFHKKEGRSEPS